MLAHKPQDSAKTSHQVFASRLFRSRLKLKLNKVLGSVLLMDDTQRSEGQSQQSRQTMDFSVQQSERTESTSGRLPDVTRTQFLENSAGVAFCKHCSVAVSSRVKSLRTHLKKCDYFLKSSKGASTLTSTMLESLRSAFDRFGVRKKKDDISLNRKDKLEDVVVQNELIPLSPLRQYRMKVAFVNYLVYHNLPFALANSQYLAEFLRTVNPCSDIFMPSTSAAKKILGNLVKDNQTLLKKIDTAFRRVGYSMTCMVLICDIVCPLTTN